MKILDILYKQYTTSNKTGPLILFAVISVVIVFSFLFFVLTFRFNEVFSTSGILEPSKKDMIVLSFDGKIEQNFIQTGTFYKKGDPIVVLDKNDIFREQENLKRNIDGLKIESEFLEMKLRVNPSIVSVLDQKMWYVQLNNVQVVIKQHENELKNLEDILTENVVTAPYDSIIVYSDYKGISSGYIPRGAVLCKLVAVNDPVIRVNIQKVWYSRVSIEQDAIIIDKLNIFHGSVTDLHIEEEDDILNKYAFISVHDQPLSNFGMEYKVKIITDSITIYKTIMRSFRSLP